MTPWTREAVLRASEDWQWVPPGAEALDVAGVPVIDYPEWARMGFYAMPATVSGPVEVVVDAVMAAARDRGRGIIDWWITPSTEPSTLEAHPIECPWP